MQDMEEFTEKEQKAAFQLGSTTFEIMLLSGRDNTPESRRDIRLRYHKYIGILSWLGIHLQDPPPEDTTTDDEMETIFTKKVIKSMNALLEEEIT